MSTTRVLRSVAEHLDGFELAEPVQVAVRTCLGSPKATVQLSGTSLPALAADLLAWADTLDNVTATAWRPQCPDADQVLLEIRGRLTDDIPVKVFGGLLDGPSLPGLVAGERIELAWPLLRVWAALAEEVAA